MNDYQSEGSVQSADGTQIGFLKLGVGPAIVFVHGSLAKADQWLPVARKLAKEFSCYLVDRRGRGSSGDSEDYSLAKESEDIIAILDIAGPSACLLGHSYGGICVLEAARSFPIQKLVLYEPPLNIQHTVLSPVFEDFRKAIDENELDAALTIGLRKIVRLSAREVYKLRKSPLWSPMVALTPTWIREREVVMALELGVERFIGINSSTLLLVGAESAAHHIEASLALEGSLSYVRTHKLEGEAALSG